MSYTSLFADLVTDRARLSIAQRKKISSRRAINRDKLYVSFFYLTFCSIYYDIRGNKFKVKGGYAYGGERAGGGGMVSPWKHRCESLLRNNRPAWEEKAEVSTKSFPNGKGSKGLNESLKLSLEIFNGENDRS